MSDIPARLRSLPDDTLTALAFFSRLPVKPVPATFDLSRSAGAWPVAGLLVALAPALLFLLARGFAIPPTVGAILAFAALAFLTGGMHEDGLADAADGFGGGASREAKLALMRDSRLGTYGALALVFAILVKIVALGAIGVSPLRGALAILCAAALSRSLALWHWSTTMPARSDGMAVSAGRPDPDALTVGGIAGLAAALILFVAFQSSALLALILAALGVLLLSRLCDRQIGGHTGDTIGAAQQIAEALIFAGLASAATSALP